MPPSPAAKHTLPGSQSDDAQHGFVQMLPLVAAKSSGVRVSWSPQMALSHEPAPEHAQPMDRHAPLSGGGGPLSGGGSEASPASPPTEASPPPFGTHTCAFASHDDPFGHPLTVHAFLASMHVPVATTHACPLGHVSFNPAHVNEGTVSGTIASHPAATIAKPTSASVGASHAVRLLRVRDKRSSVGPQRPYDAAARGATA